ncbi:MULTISPECIES: integrin alpha [Streptomyces]|uniref:integrin alpha n=1 Tax=Streptomyces TaxID=1883 RepID=UPI0004CCA565|nr:FG-GAP repeat protein [Streptomyces durhamensis]
MSHLSLRRCALTIATGVALAVGALAVPAHAATASVPSGRHLHDDFDGDGYADLAVGAPGENTKAGAVWVVRGTAAGLTPTGSSGFASGTLGTVATGAQPGHRFGC